MLGVQWEADGINNSRNVIECVFKGLSMMSKLKNVKPAQMATSSAQIQQLVFQLTAQMEWSSIHPIIIVILAPIKPNMIRRVNPVSPLFVLDKRFGTPKHYSVKIAL